MRRNIDDHFAKLPVTHLPRTRHSLNVTSRKSSQGHGRLTPFFIAPVYPGDTWSIEMAAQCRMDTSARVPLDSVYDDIYFFFVPYRIIDKDFVKVLGERDNPYDDSTYSIPQYNFSFPTSGEEAINFLPLYLNYGASDLGQLDEESVVDSVSAYPIRAFWKIWNDFFRDEQLDAAVDIDSIKYSQVRPHPANSSILQLPLVNKFHDYFTSAMKSAIRGPEVYIPSNGAAPVYGYNEVGLSTIGSTEFDFDDDGAIFIRQSMDGDVPDGSLEIVGGDSQGQMFLGADVKASAGTIAQLTLAMQLYQLYDRKNRYGTRYIEQLRGLWSIEVPDGLLQRPEYLGGTQVALSNVPIFDNTTSSLGAFAGSSQTTFAGASFTKSFVEYGLIIGLSVTRIKHTYGQGVDTSIWGLVDELDLYNPIFANIGNMKIENREIWNAPGTDSNKEVFAYQEAWSRLRNIPDSFAGLFANITFAEEGQLDTISSASEEVRSLFTYSDYYENLPTFSAEWLKEDPTNLYRTLTGRTVPTASSFEGHQFLFNYMVKPTITRILPAHSVPAGLFNRL